MYLISGARRSHGLSSGESLHDKARGTQFLVSYLLLVCDVELFRLPGFSQFEDDLPISNIFIPVYCILFNFRYIRSSVSYGEN